MGIEVPPEVFRELNTLNESCDYNSYLSLRDGLIEHGLDRAFAWVDTHRDEATVGAVCGFRPQD